MRSLLCLAILTTTAAVNATTIDYSLGGLSYAEVSVTVLATATDRELLGVRGNFRESSFTGTTEQDGLRIQTNGVKTTIGAHDTIVKVREFWTGEEYETFTMSITVDQDITYVVEDFDDEFLPDRIGDQFVEYAGFPSRGKDFSITVDPVEFDWTLTGPRSEVGGSAVQTFVSNNDRQWWQLDPSALPILDTFWRSARDITPLWEGELDSVELTVRSFGTSKGHLVPEPSSAVLLCIGLLAIVRRRR